MPPMTERNLAFFFFFNPDYIREIITKLFTRKPCHAIYLSVKGDLILCNQHGLVINVSASFMQHTPDKGFL